MDQFVYRKKLSHKGGLRLGFGFFLTIYSGCELTGHKTDQGKVRQRKKKERKRPLTLSTGAECIYE